MPTITRNAVECAFCGTVIESTHVHDCKFHVCDAMKTAHPEITRAWDGLMVDGGTAYLRRGFVAAGDYIERSEFCDQE